MKMRHHSKLTVSRRLELYKPMGVGRHKRRVRPGFHHNKAMFGAVFQLVCGAGALILGTISVITNSWGYYFGCGFWGGSFFMAAGLCGIVACIRKNNTPITIFVVFSGIAFVLAVIMLALASVGISQRTLHIEPKVTKGSSVVVLGLHMFIAVMEIISSVTSIAICLRAICMKRHSDRQYEIAVQSPVSSEFAPQAPQARSNSYGQYELCSDFDTEFTVSEGLTPLAPSSQLPTTCTEELPILSSVLDNNLTPDDSTCLLQKCTEPDTLLDSPAVASITAQEENAVNDLLETSPVAPPGTPPPSYRQAAKRSTSTKSSNKITGKADNKGKTTASRTRNNQDTSQKKPIAPIAKPPAGPTRRNRTTSEPGMKKSASQTSNRSMQSAASHSRQSSHSSVRSRADSSSSRKDADGGSPAKHKRPSHLDIPPKGTSSRTRGQVRSRSTRPSGAAGSQQTSAAKSVARGASQSQRGARTPSSRSGPSQATSGTSTRGLTRSGSRTSTSSLKGATGTQKPAQEKKSSEPATSTTSGSAGTKSTRTNPPTRSATSQSRPRPGSTSSTGGSRPRNQAARGEGSSGQPQRSPLDTLL